MRRMTRAGSLAAPLLALAVALPAVEAEQFVAVHGQATQLGDEGKWTEAAKVYGTFAAQHAARDFAPLAAIFQGITLRRELGQAGEARKAFARADRPAATPFDRELQRVARAWLARLQMETLDAALRKYYVRHVQYPEKLSDLVKARLATSKQLADPWGNPFAYELGRLLVAPKMPQQKYTLRCTTLEGDSTAIEQVLERSKSFGGDVQLRAIVPTTPVKAIVTLTDDPDKRITITEGAKLGAATVARIVPRAIVLIEAEQVACLTTRRGR